MLLFKLIFDYFFSKCKILKRNNNCTNCNENCKYFGRDFFDNGCVKNRKNLKKCKCCQKQTDSCIYIYRSCHACQEICHENNYNYRECLNLFTLDNSMGLCSCCLLENENVKTTTTQLVKTTRGKSRLVWEKEM